MKIWHSTGVLAAFGLVLAASHPAHAGSIAAKYDADAETPAPDPTTNAGGDWLVRAFGGGATGNPVDDDGTNAWQVRDVGQQSIWYGQDISDSNYDLLATNGWEMTANLRMVDAGSSASVGSTGFFYHTNAANGNERWLVIFDLDPNGDLIARAQEPGAPGAFTTKSATLIGDGTGANDYHSIAIRNATGTGSAELLFDGQPVTFDDGTTTFNPLVISPFPAGKGAVFGAIMRSEGGTPADGTANFNMVKLRANVIPEPSTFVLGLLAAMSLLGYVMRRTRAT